MSVARRTHKKSPHTSDMEHQSDAWDRFAVALALIGVILVGLSLAGCERSDASPAAPPPPAVSVAAVVAKSVTYWDEFPGRVAAIDSVEIRPRVAGYIDSIRFREGDEVKRGDVLFVIDRRPYLAEVARTSAEVGRTRTQAELARTQAERAKKLLDGRAISQEEYDLRVATEAESTAAVHAAEAAAEVAKLNLEYTEVRSPIDGRAGQALITVGNLVAPNTSLLTSVVSLDRLYVYFETDEQTYLHYADLAQRGERSNAQDAHYPVQVALANETGFPHEGTLDFIDNHVNATTGTIRARAVLDNKDRLLTPGLFARVRLLGSGQVNALLVDEKAVLTDQDRKYVYVVDAQNHAQRRDVKLGRQTEGLRTIASGLSPGDRVIVAGMQKVFMPGQPVAPALIDMGAPPAATVASKETAAQPESR